MSKHAFEHHKSKKEQSPSHGLTSHSTFHVSIRNSKNITSRHTVKPVNVQDYSKRDNSTTFQGKKAKDITRGSQIQPEQQQNRQNYFIDKSAVDMNHHSFKEFNKSLTFKVLESKIGGQQLLITATKKKKKKKKAIPGVPSR